MNRRFTWLLFAVAISLLAASAAAQELLDGEFGNIDLGRPLIEPKRFPTLKELRSAARKPQITTVMMFKLYGDGNNHYLPIWSADGMRLAFQRSNVQERSSKILLYQTLSQPQPQSLSDDPQAYDYMFRWGQNSAGAYAFVRIAAEAGGVQVYFAPADGEAAPRTKGAGRYASPALYERTDGIWRLAYDRDGQLLHEAFNAAETIESPLDLGRGTSPRWSRDGFRLLLARGRAGGQLAAYDIALRNLKTGKESLLSKSAVVRSPMWSPTEEHVAWYAKDAGDNKPWRIEVGAAAGTGAARPVGGDVVVNANFEAEGPAWEPSGRRLWYFSHRQHQQAYYPLVTTDLASSEETVVDYPNRCTTPTDLAVNPLTVVPEIVFVAHEGLPQDLFVLFLNHY